MDTLLTLTRRRLLQHAVPAATALRGTTALAGLGVLGLTGCSRSGPDASRVLQRLSGWTMGTAYTVLLAGGALSRPRLEHVHAEVQAVLDAVDHRFSLHRADSELLLLNRLDAGQTLRVSPSFMAVLQAAATVRQASGGAFDVSVAPLVMAWGFAPDLRQGHAAPVQRPSLPPAAVREQFARQAQGRTQASPDPFLLDPTQRLVGKRDAGVQADLGGIAKGYGVDRVAQSLHDLGLTDFMVEVGGEVRAAGLNGQGLPWQIGLEQPVPGPRRVRVVLPLSDQALATSGDYRQFIDADGQRYSHGMDPWSGAPASHGLASVTVRADTCMQADALATALMAMGPQRGYAWAQREKLAAHFVLRAVDGQLHDLLSDAMAGSRST